jgi:hypothetical protein
MVNQWEDEILAYKRKDKTTTSMWGNKQAS